MLAAGFSEVELTSRSSNGFENTSDRDGPVEVFSGYECAGAEFDIVVDQCHDLGGGTSENKLGATRKVTHREPRAKWPTK